MSAGPALPSRPEEIPLAPTRVRVLVITEAFAWVSIEHIIASGVAPRVVSLSAKVVRMRARALADLVYPHVSHYPWLHDPLVHGTENGQIIVSASMYLDAAGLPHLGVIT